MYKTYIKTAFFCCSPFVIGVRNKSKKGPFSSKDLAVHKYFR